MKLLIAKEAPCSTISILPSLRLCARLAQSPVSTLAVLVVLGSVVFFGIFLFFQVVAKWVQGDPSQADRRLPSAADTDPSASGTITIPPPPKDPFDRFDNYFERFLRNTALGLSTAQSTAFMLFLAVILATATYLWREVAWLSCVAFVIGLMIPLAFFWFLQNRYRNQIQQSLPDTYYQLARSLCSGMTLEQAIEQVATRGQKPVSEEFQRATQQIKLGLSVPKALELMAPRIGLVDFDALVSTVSIYTQTGGNLALLLDRLAASTRDRNQFRGYFRSATAQGA